MWSIFTPALTPSIDWRYQAESLVELEHGSNMGLISIGQPHRQQSRESGSDLAHIYDTQLATLGDALADLRSYH
jgi:hypothetical protein